jgi:hypothetical protein
MCSVGVWTPPYDRIFSANPSLASREQINEKDNFEPHMCAYTTTAEFITTFQFKHLPLAVATLMHRHGLTLHVAKTIADGHKNAFWLTGEVPTKDCGKTIQIDKHSRVHGKGYVTQVLCAALATLHMQGEASTAEFATENGTPNFKPYSMLFGTNGFVQLYFRFHGKLLKLTLGQEGGADGRSTPRIFLFDGSSVPTPFDVGQPQFPELRSRAWHPPYQLCTRA